MKLRDLRAVVAEAHGQTFSANDPIAVNFTVMQTVGQHLLDAHAATADDLRELLDDIKAEVAGLAGRRVAGGSETIGEQVTDREYSGVAAGTSVALLAEEMMRYRKERNEARRERDEARGARDAALARLDAGKR